MGKIGSNPIENRVRFPGFSGRFDLEERIALDPNSANDSLLVELQGWGCYKMGVTIGF